MAGPRKVCTPAGRKVSTKGPAGPRAPGTPPTPPSGQAAASNSQQGLVTRPPVRPSSHDAVNATTAAIDCTLEFNRLADDTGAPGPAAWFPLLTESEVPTSREGNDSDVSMVCDLNQMTRPATASMHSIPPHQVLLPALVESSEGQILEQADGVSTPVELTDALGVAQMLAQEGITVEQGAASAGVRSSGPDHVFVWVPLPPIAIRLEDVPPTTKSRGEPVQPFGVRFQVRPLPAPQQDRQLLASRFLRFAHLATGIPLAAFCNYVVHPSAFSIDYIMESAGLARHLSRRIRAAEIKGSNHELHTFRWIKDGPRHGPEVYW